MQHFASSPRSPPDDGLFFRVPYRRRHRDGDSMRWLKPQPQSHRAQPPAARPGDPKRSPPINMPPRRTWLTFLAIIALNYLVMRLLFPGPDAPSAVPYTF